MAAPGGPPAPSPWQGYDYTYNEWYRYDSVENRWVFASGRIVYPRSEQGTPVTQVGAASSSNGNLNNSEQPPNNVETAPATDPTPTRGVSDSSRENASSTLSQNASMLSVQMPADFSAPPHTGIKNNTPEYGDRREIDRTYSPTTASNHNGSYHRDPGRPPPLTRAYHQNSRGDENHAPVTHHAINATSRSTPHPHTELTHGPAGHPLTPGLWQATIPSQHRPMQPAPQFPMSPPPGRSRVDPDYWPRQNPSARREDVAQELQEQAELEPQVRPCKRIEGTLGDQERLDPNFKVRRPGGEFFRIGRVFKVLWPELVGEGTAPPTISAQQVARDRVARDPRFNQDIYVKIRWFVVVRRGHNCCHCLPIQTYSRRGVSAVKMKSHHAIIFTGDYAPAPQPSELPKGPWELPMGDSIRVESTNLWEKLDPLSRVNFQKIYTVEHNVKVYDFGKVAKESMVKLIHQFKEAWGIAETSSSSAPRRPTTGAATQPVNGSSSTYRQPRGTGSQEQPPAYSGTLAMPPPYPQPPREGYHHTPGVSHLQAQRATNGQPGLGNGGLRSTPQQGFPAVSSSEEASPVGISGLENGRMEYEHTVPPNNDDLYADTSPLTEALPTQAQSTALGYSETSEYGQERGHGLGDVHSTVHRHSQSSENGQGRGDDIGAETGRPNDSQMQYRIPLPNGTRFTEVRAERRRSTSEAKPKQGRRSRTSD